MRPHRDHADGNAAELYANLERDGWAVVRIATAVQRRAGVPDALVVRKTAPRPAWAHLLEVKRLGGRASAAQIQFAINWHGCVHIAHSSWEANLLLNECEERNSGRAIA